MGSGSGVAIADTVNAEPEVEFVNGGKNRLWAFTTLYRPALVQEPIAISVKKLNHPKWGIRSSFQVPKVLQVVGGVPVTLRSFEFTIGGKPYAKDFIASTSCPKGGKAPYRATVHYLYNDNTTASSDDDGTIACRR